LSVNEDCHGGAVLVAKPDFKIKYNCGELRLGKPTI